MKIALITRNNSDEVWGGDLKAISSIKEGFLELGHSAEILNCVTNISNQDFVFLGVPSSTTLFPSYVFLKSFAKQNFGTIPFYEDQILFDNLSNGLYVYVRNNIVDSKKNGIDFSIERLIEDSSIVNSYAHGVRKRVLENIYPFHESKVNIVNSEMEKRALLRDCPNAKVKVVYLTGECDGFKYEDEPDDFLKLCNLQKGNYILQVGRLEIRKNQMTTMLACKDLDVPLVFIATKTTSKSWIILMHAILKYRKAPTIIVSQDLPECNESHLKVIRTPNNDVIRGRLLYSAFVNAGVYVHPSFYETPGYVYLEAVKAGIPIVASSWGSVKEYLSDRTTKEYLLDDRIQYVSPLDIKKIEQLIQENLGKKYSKDPNLWIYSRTKKEMAKEIVDSIS